MLKRRGRRVDTAGMPKMLLLALVAAAALILGAAPAFATHAGAPASASHAFSSATASDDDVDPGDESGEDPDDDWDEDPDEDWSEDDDGWGDDDACVEEWDDDAVEWVAVDGDCSGDEGLCWEDDWSEDEDWGDDDLTAASATSDDDWADDSCDEAADEPAPLVTKLRATPARHGRDLRVQVRFRLDRAGDVALKLERVGGAARSSHRCTAPARTSRAAAGKGKGKKDKSKAKRCSSDSVALSGTMSVAGRAGKNATTLRRWKGRPLAPGSYRLTVTPDAAGARSAKTTFKVAAPRPQR